MTDKSESQLADQARTALLEGVIRSATGNGTAAKAFAEAYAIIDASAPTDKPQPGSPITRRDGLAGRR
jgi:hypothetical protein